MSDDNRATGVRYLHRVHKQEGEVHGRTVVVACACVQSIALLLMSTSRRYPDGTGQFERPAGAALHPALHRWDRVRAREPPRQADDQRRGVPRSRLPAVVHARPQAELRAQLRRAAELPEPPAWLAGRRPSAASGRGYKAAVKGGLPRLLSVHPYGEMLPNADSFVDLDRAQTDAYGLPVARRQVAGAGTRRRSSTTWCVGACRCWTRPEPRF